LKTFLSVSIHPTTVIVFWLLSSKVDGNVQTLIGNALLMVYYHISDADF